MLSILNRAIVDEDWTVEHHKSRHINPLISNAFNKAGLVEKFGTSITKILDSCKDAGNPEPLFETASTDNASKETILVLAREEKEFPDLYKKKANETILEEKSESSEKQQREEDTQTMPASLKSNVMILGPLFPSPKAGNFSYEEDQSGVSYDKLFGDYLDGATRIEIQDPYIIKPYQTRNLLEFLEVVYHHKKPEDEVTVSLLTKADRDYFEDQDMGLSRIKDSAALIGIDFEYSYEWH